MTHWTYFEQAPFTREQRSSTTVLFGGLTEKHERIVRGALSALGYRCEIVPTPTVEDFQTGKEHGNYGQCNPTYFTVGALVNHLRRLEREGRSKAEVLQGYVYITPESPCGPCRLGMYQNEYRLACENAGFGGFRVIPFSQRPSLSGESGEGLDVGVDFSLALLFSILAADAVNQAGYAIRPYEVEPGATDRVVERAVDRLEAVAARLDFPGLEEAGRVAGAAGALLPGRRGALEAILKLHRWLAGENRAAFLGALEEIGAWFDAIDVDRFRVRPIVKITGEFWAQTTEGDGNFGMFDLLGSEGAEVFVEPVATGLYYLLHGARQDVRDRSRLGGDDLDGPGLVDRVRGLAREKRGTAIVDAIDRAYRGLWGSMRAALGGIPHDLIDMEDLEALAHGFYNSRLEGGEGHLEVAKNVWYHVHHRAHMVLSLKPFGCMPSTQSDAVQAAARGAFGDMIYLPVETSGEGRINALSRVQMALGEARRKANEEMRRALDDAGLTIEEVRERIEADPALRRPSTPLGRPAGVVGTAARVVARVASETAVPA